MKPHKSAPPKSSQCVIKKPEVKLGGGGGRDFFGTGEIEQGIEDIKFQPGDSRIESSHDSDSAPSSDILDDAEKMVVEDIQQLQKEIAAAKRKKKKTQH